MLLLQSILWFKLGEIGTLTFNHCRGIPKWEWNSTIPISKGSSAMIWLHCVKM